MREPQDDQLLTNNIQHSLPERRAQRPHRESRPRLSAERGSASLQQGRTRRPPLHDPANLPFVPTPHVPPSPGPLSSHSQSTNSALLPDAAAVCLQTQSSARTAPSPKHSSSFPDGRDSWVYPTRQYPRQKSGLFPIPPQSAAWSRAQSCIGRRP